MTKHFLNVPHRCAVLEHVRGAGVTEGVRADVSLDMGKINASLHDLPDGHRVHLLSITIKDQITIVLFFYVSRSHGKDVVSD